MQRQEQAVLHLINSTEIGKTLRENSFGHSFDKDPISKMFDKNKDITHKRPDVSYLVNGHDAVAVEYDENDKHEKSVVRLQQIKELLGLHVEKEIKQMKQYNNSKSSSSSFSETSSIDDDANGEVDVDANGEVDVDAIKRFHVVRINGHDKNNDAKKVCNIKERRATEGEFTTTYRYYELSDHGGDVVIEACKKLEEIYCEIRSHENDSDNDSDDDTNEIDILIYEINE